MSTLLKNKQQMIHIVSEVVVLLGLTFYFSSKNKKLMQHIEDLAQRLEEQEDNIQKHDQLIRQLAGTIQQLNTSRPVSIQPTQPSQPSQQSQQLRSQQIQQTQQFQPQPQQQLQPNHRQSIISTKKRKKKRNTNVRFSKPKPSPPSPKIVEISEEESSSENDSDLDHEIMEELRDLENETSLKKKR